MGEFRSTGAWQLGVVLLFAALLPCPASPQFVAGPVGRPDRAAAVQESYAIDGRDILIRQIPQGPGVLVLPPMVALARKYGLDLRIEDTEGNELKVTDLNVPTRHGPTLRVETDGYYQTRAPVGRYIFKVPGSPPPQDEVLPLVRELSGRVEQFIASGHQGPLPREYGYLGDLVFWFTGETISALAQALPYLEADLKLRASQYLAGEVERFLLDEQHLAFERQGTSGIVSWSDNTATTGLAIAALFDYAHHSGDWDLAARLWPACRRQFAEYNLMDWHFGCNPKGLLWVARFQWISDLPAQIASASAVARLARRLNDPETEALAAGIAARLLITRYAYGVYVRPYLYENQLASVPGQRGRGGELISTLPGPHRYEHTNWPYDAPRTMLWPKAMRLMEDGSNDLRVVVEPLDGQKTYRVGMTPADYNHKAMVLHYPMNPGQARFVGDMLEDRTREIFNAFQANMPWWHWADFETIIERGDETVASPDVSFAMYQTLAWSLGAGADELRRRLPWEYLNVGFRDRFRLINLGTYLRCTQGAKWEESR